MEKTVTEIPACKNERSEVRDNHRPSSFGASDWLHFAATPTLVLMALVVAASGGGPADMLCPAAQGMPPLSGMAVVYLLMAAFHAGPWLKLIAGRRR